MLCRLRASWFCQNRQCHHRQWWCNRSHPCWAVEHWSVHSLEQQRLLLLARPLPEKPEEFSRQFIRRLCRYYWTFLSPPTLRPCGWAWWRWWNSRRSLVSALELSRRAMGPGGCACSLWGCWSSCASCQPCSVDQWWHQRSLLSARYHNWIRLQEFACSSQEFQ